jgi:hypothetical protein
MQIFDILIAHAAVKKEERHPIDEVFPAAA